MYHKKFIATVGNASKLSAVLADLILLNSASYIIHTKCF